MSPLADSPLPVARTVADLRRQVSAWRADGLRVGLVPTMGALHEGHLSLVRRALEDADRVIASLFVNPAQFAPHEDFDAYPRGEERDAALLAGAGCHLLYAPQASEIYPPGFATTVTVSGVSAPMEGERRPQFFAGVATVVAKLLIQASADVAVFGEKDYQQLQVIKRMARDLDLPTRILGAPTLRAEDGLALSSRNAYLTARERPIAGKLNGVMAQLARSVAGGAAAAAAEVQATAALIAAGFDSVDYIEVRHAEDLSPLGPGPIGDAPARVLAAAWLGKTRLIDNMAV
ncbi:MAG: pantoate/beta-alanine ligase [Caulobacteraceae bacterium]|nr:pantoate/beta-alanine ligase [Caulobacteraceae bacterium]